jgi:plasmid segregation protein ParM
MQIIGVDVGTEIDGERYFVGNMAKESYFYRAMTSENKIHQESFVLCMTALAVLTRPKEAINLITGLPITQHHDKTKQALIKLLSGFHTITVNGTAKTFQVGNILIAPEGAAAFWDAVLDNKGTLHDTKLIKELVRIVDIGSRTINYCTVEQRKYLDRDSGTLPYGIIELLNAKKKPDDNMKAGFARRIVADLSQKWLNYNPEEDTILFTGGGSLLLEKWIRPEFRKTQLAFDAVMANALGYYKMGVLKWAAR